MFAALPESSGVCHPRRAFLRAGAGLAVAGFPLAPGARAVLANAPRSGPQPPAQSCILVYLLGGPPHLDTFDLKPQAAAEVRGPFQPIPTNVPGLDICEHLPKLARLADKYSLMRAVSHPNSNHTPMIYYTLTGRPHEFPLQDNDVRPPQRGDFPHVGSVLASLKRGNALLPGYVAVPELAVRSSLSGQYQRARSPLRGGSAGFLGAWFDPLPVNGEPGTAAAVPTLALPREVSAERFEQRAALLAALDRTPATRTYQALQEQAVVLTGTASRGRLEPFRLDAEPPAVRQRYGEHRFGKALLLARRLAEARVPMVAVHFNEMTICDGWDTHSQNFEALQSELLPMLDQGLSALLEDLDQRGRLQETLVVCLGEFGRTPKINANAGRDHWGDCSSALLAGGGVRGGQVLGASDKIGAYPVSDRIDPVDIHATLYHCLGINPHQTLSDQAQRPWEISTGRVIERLL
jgi:hypothetical protein